MKSGNWMAIATVVVFATSCGESSTKESSSTTTITTTDTLIPETVPVATTVVVPEPTRSSFEKQYPNVSNVSWSRYEPVNTFDWEWAGWSPLDTTDYVVTYKLDNNDYWTWYDDDNNWVGTVTTITDFEAGLPAAVNNSIKSNFDGYTIVSVDKENDKNRTAYEVELTKGDDKMKALIAENGTVLKKKAIVAGEK